MTTMLERYTRAEYDRLPEGFPAQLIEGCLVKEPPPRYGHQRLASRLHVALVSVAGAERAVFAPVDVPIDDFNVFQPDLAVLRGTPPDHARDVGVPLLVIEILSPSTCERDRVVKCGRYLDAGVSEVWLVDGHNQTIELHTRGGHQVFRGRDAATSGVVDGLRVVPQELFERSSGS